MDASITILMIGHRHYKSWRSHFSHKEWKFYLVVFEPFFQVDEEDPVGVDGPEDDAVAQEAGDHHQPGLKTSC